MTATHNLLAYLRNNSEVLSLLRNHVAELACYVITRTVGSQTIQMDQIRQSIEEKTLIKVLILTSP